jgi:hypothetical protein
MTHSFRIVRQHPTLVARSLPRLIVATLVAGALLLGARAADAAGTPEQQCQATKDKSAGKYAACRQNAEAKLATTAKTPADLLKYDDTLTTCGTKLESAWQKAIDKAAAASVSCPDAPLTEVQFQTILAESTDNIADALAGLGLTDCSADLATCAGDLGTCTGDLGTCTTGLTQATSDLGTCNGTVTTLSGNLTTCNGSLTTCNGNLGTCTSSLATANGSLTTCNGSLGTCNGSLGTCTTSLATANGSLTTCNGNLGTCTTSLATANGSLTTCNGSLGTCNADLTTCNGTVGTLTGNLSTCNGSLTTCNGSLGTCNASLGTCTTNLANLPGSAPGPAAEDRSDDLLQRCRHRDRVRWHWAGRRAAEGSRARLHRQRRWHDHGHQDGVDVGEALRRWDHP